MNKKKLNMISDYKSPLFRIMSIYNSEDKNRRCFYGNICAFHIGNGFILSVGHNLRTSIPFPDSISDTIFNSEIKSLLIPQELTDFQKIYDYDQTTKKWYIKKSVKDFGKIAFNIFNRINYDRRPITFYSKGICTPYLIIQFQENSFYKNVNYLDMMPTNSSFHEPNLGRYTFIIKLDFIEAFYQEDYSIYQINSDYKKIIKFIPFIDIDYNIYDSLKKDFYCLQGAPIGYLGRMLNQSNIEGLLDHFNIISDRIGGNYFCQGLRYIIRGYFRFGSSGAPYLKYNKIKRKFAVNAIQSEACPLQLMIKNDQKGNFQYVNAIASPISNIKKKIESII
ncbi:hypothetical protein ES695_02980 [Candidatus Atribacteria bacterium 1244-E10-H5-B2]|nr:MAG: hypothetical protein ES695_02980 [Candidatus Atribacteria bacterium 1244-E10-H5-B2]